MKKWLLLLLLIQQINAPAQEHKDLVYAKTPQRDLTLDIYLPPQTTNAQLIIWVHGGAWHGGSKADPPKELLPKGYALASIEYRLTTEAVFPAMIHDIKASIRFLRANQKKYGYQADKIILWGSSAGGHLAAVAALSNQDAFLEGTLGDYTSTSSRVDLLLDLFGPSNFKNILAQSTPHGINVRAPALALFFGKPLEKVDAKLVEKASPVFLADAQDPPCFLAHGNQDAQVPINQSIELHLKLQALKVSSALHFLNEMGHGGKDFSAPDFVNLMDQFIKKHL
ncbi:MAG TPA: alpha/beta hydrolase [Haliscomenobacter sp.]|nr:alpha/beta hydrolase [Haliscomenobacter sp.]